MNLKKNIKKKLLETKLRKEKILIEKELIKSRILMIVEDKRNVEKFDSLSETKKIKLSFKLLEEIAFHKSNGVLSEDLSDVMTSLFGSKVGEVIGDSIIEPALNYILTGLSIQDNNLRQFVVSHLGEKESFTNNFKDCDSLTDGISDAIVEFYNSKNQTVMASDVFVKDLFMNLFQDPDIKIIMAQSLKKQLRDKVCELFNKMTTNATSVLDKIKTDLNLEPNRV